jgi:phenylalanyl-tRNA synthetase beta chain
LVDRGFFEAIHYTFVEPGLQRRLFPEVRALALSNPISSELGEMRVSLWPGLLKGLIENVRRQQTRVNLFEFGSKFILQDNDLKEIKCISGLAFGSVEPEQWGVSARPVDFYDVKADVEAVLAAGGYLADARFVAETLSCLHPGRSARIYCGDRAIGWLGELHPQIGRALEVTPAPMLFEIELSALPAARLPRAAELSKFPAVRRDLAVVVDEGCTFNELRESVTVAASSLLREMTTFDVYRGRGIETGRKSIAISLIIQDKLKTLTDADVDTVLAAIRSRLLQDLNATFRD